MKYRFHINKSFAKNAWEIYAFAESNQTRHPIKILIERGPPHQEFAFMEPAIEIRNEEFQDVIIAIKEGLAEAGLLADSSASQAELKATKYHLEDMRKLALI